MGLMQLTRKRNKWPRLGITGFFGGLFPPITAAVDINAQEEQVIIPGVIPPPISCSIYTAADLFVTFANINTCLCTEFTDGDEGTKYFHTEFDDDPNQTFLLTNVPSGVIGVTSWEAPLGNIFTCISPVEDPACEGCSRGGFPEPPPGYLWEEVAVTALVQCGPSESGGNAFAIAIYGVMLSGRVLLLFTATVFDSATADCLSCWTLASTNVCAETGTLSNPSGQTDFWKVGLDGEPYIDGAVDGDAFLTAS